MTLFLLEYQEKNDGSATAAAPLGYTDTNAALCAFFDKCAAAVVSNCDTHTVILATSEGEVWQEYKQVLHHGQE